MGFDAINLAVVSVKDRHALITQHHPVN